MSNWIPDTNRFHLAGPPRWWLDQLHEFDPSLVVVPSRQGFYYRLAQRRKLRLPEKFANDMLFQEYDTKMLASYSLVPVTTILSTARWGNPLMWNELAERAPWRQGGSKKYIQKLEAQEHQAKVDQHREISDRLDTHARDAWNLYRMQQGLRQHMWDGKPRAAPQILPSTTAHATIDPAMFTRYENPRRRV